MKPPKADTPRPRRRTGPGTGKTGPGDSPAMLFDLDGTWMRWGFGLGNSRASRLRGDGAGNSAITSRPVAVREQGAQLKGYALLHPGNPEVECRFS